ncbi:MAG: hypothetical protein MI924_00405 [Chloroflexales bacterium]|nr:hypothetical protein [Chloroflexales bacterium]
MSIQITIAALTGDFVLYRDLQPCDPKLPGLAELRSELGFSPDLLPRKRDPDGAKVILEIIRQASAQQGSAAPQAFLVIGDTDNDRHFANHLRHISGCPVRAFIGVDHLADPPDMRWDGETATANRWALLETWLDQVRTDDLVNEQTVVLLDIDKTLLGPRGRCDVAIDDARAEGAWRIASVTLGDAIEQRAFHSFYATLCRKEYHGLTLDNQDYVVYIAMLLVSDTLSFDQLRQGMVDGSFHTFTTLLGAVEPRLHPALANLQAEIRAADAAGDPTPFKAFRHAEFVATVARMTDGRLTLCREVVELAQHLAAQGLCCVAVSDKPAEASLPTPEQTLAGLQPLHYTAAWVA